MKILATIHFIDGQTLEKEFCDGHSCEDAWQHKLRIFLYNTAWFEMPNNAFLPVSQIAKVVWKELPE